MTLPQSVLGELSEYDFRHLCAHLISANGLDNLRRLLTMDSGQGNAWYVARDARGELDTYLRDLDEADKAAARAGSPSQTVLRCLYRLMACSARNANSHLPPDFLLALAIEGIWPLSQAVGLAHQQGDDQGVAGMLLAVSPLLQGRLAEEAADLAAGIREPRTRIRVVSALMPRLPEARRAEAVERIVTELRHSLGDGPEKALPRTAIQLAGEPPVGAFLMSLLPALAPHLPTRLLGEVVDACAFFHADDALASLAPHLPEHLLDAAIEAARAIKPTGVVALSALAARVSTPRDELLYAEALRAARLLHPASERGAALGNMARHLNSHRRRDVLREAVSCIPESSDDLFVYWAASWSKDLPSDEADLLLKAALDAALRLEEGERDVDRPTTRADALVHLAGVLTPPLLDRALVAAWDLKEPYDRLRAAAALSVRLNPQKRGRAVARVAELARAEWSHWWGPETLLKLAPHLPEVPERILSEVRGHLGAWNGSYLTLRELLPPDGWRNLLSTVLTAVRMIDDRPEQAGLIAQVSRFAGGRDRDRHIASAMTRLRRVARADTRIHTALDVASALPPAQSAALLEEASTWIREVPSYWSWHAGRATEELVRALVERGLIEAAWRAADALRDFDEQAVLLRVLTTLAPYAGDDRLGQLESLSRASPPSLDKVKAVGALAGRSNHPRSRWAEALHVVGELPLRAEFIESQASKALVFLAPLLPEELLRPAVRHARELKDGHHRSIALAAVAQRCAASLRARLLREALDAARSSSLTVRRGRFLATLLPYLPEQDRPRIAAEALDLLIRTDFSGQRLAALVDLVPYLPKDSIMPIIRHDLVHSHRTHGGLPALSAAARLLPDAEQFALAKEIAEVAAAIGGANDSKFRHEMLECVSQLVVPAQTAKHRHDVVLGILSQLASRTRPDFLNDLRMLAPCLVADDQRGADELAEVVSDVCRWWP